MCSEQLGQIRNFESISPYQLLTTKSHSSHHQALKAYNIFNYKYLTSHPSVKQLLLSDSSFQYKEERVVKDENLITSRGPGSAFEFAIAICEVLVGKSKTSSLISPLMLKSNPLEPEEGNKNEDALK